MGVTPEHPPLFFDGWYNIGRAAGLASQLQAFATPGPVALT